MLMEIISINIDEDNKKLRIKGFIFIKRNSDVNSSINKILGG